MKNRIKGLLSILLTLVMLVGMIPGISVAVDAAPGSYEAAWGPSADNLPFKGDLADALRANAAYVKLLKDVNVSRLGVAASGEKTLDLAGHRIEGRGNVITVFESSAKLTIIDTSSNGTGEIISTSRLSKIAISLSLGTVTVRGGNILSRISVTSGHLNVEGGKITAEDAAIDMIGGSAKITGGEIKGTSREFGTSAIRVIGGTVKLNGGTVSGGRNDIIGDALGLGKIELGVEDGKDIGATFPRGITVALLSLQDILADEVGYFAGDLEVVPFYYQTEITNKGDIVVRRRPKFYDVELIVTPEEGGEATINTERAKKGDKVTFEITPEEGYNFVFTVTTGEIEVTEESEGVFSFIMPDHAVTVNVEFRKIQHTVSFYDYDGNLIYVMEDMPTDTVLTEEQFAVAEDELPEIEVPGKKFGGWTPDETTPITGDTSFTAVMANEEYTFKFVTGIEGLEYDDVTVEYGDAVEDALPVAEHDDFNFVKWTFDLDTLEDLPTTVDDLGEDGCYVTLYAYWTADVTFVDITTNTTEQIDKGDAILDYAPEFEGKAGYTGGWYTEEGGQGTKLNATHTVDGHATYYAYYTPELDTKYTVEIYTMDTAGQYGDPVIEVLEGETDTTATYVPAEKTGFTIDTEASILSGNIAGDDSLVLKVYYSRNQYTLYTSNDGTVTKIKDYYYDEVIDEPAHPTKTGYTFKRWDGYSRGMKMGTSDITFTAVWTANPYRVKFVSEYGWGTMKDQGFIYDQPQALYENQYQRSGYKFLGWALTEDGPAVYDDGEVVVNLATSGTVTLYAVWELNPNTLPFDTYLIYVKDCENGELSVDRKRMPPETTVVVKVQPDEGYELDAVTAVTKYGYSLKVKVNSDGTVSFKMPATQVNVSATFKQIETEPAGCENCPLDKFTDVDKNAWYHDGVHYVVENEIMIGMTEDKFGPETTLTRAMLVTVLWRLEDQPQANLEMPYSDVAEGEYYTEAVRWATAQKIVEGFEDGTFKPDQTLTREQLATMLYRYEQTKGKGFEGMWMFNLDYTDAADVSDWAYEAVCWMKMNGIMEAVDGAFLPGEGASRATTANALYNITAEAAE